MEEVGLGPLIQEQKKMKVKFKMFSSLARVPTKSTPGSAWYNVYSARDVLLGPGVTQTIEIDLGFKFAKKYVWRIYPRSGLSLKPLFFGGRVTDSDYRGNISVILTNFSSRSVDIKKGDQIAQVTFLKKEEIDFEEIDEFDDSTSRETKGFGSTGLKPISCQFFVQKKKKKAINNQNQTIDFSVFTSDVEKENVIRHLIKNKQNSENLWQIYIQIIMFIVTMPL